MIQTNEIFIPIPKQINTHTKVEVNGDDLSSRVIESLWVYPCTIGIGTFKIALSNSNGQLNGLYSEGNLAKLYADNSDGTTLQFWGVVDYVKDSIGSNGQILEIEGRHRAYLLNEYLVCYSATGKVTSSILKELIDNLPANYGFTYTDVETDTTTMDVEWIYKPFWDCVIELCNKAGFDCYVDNDLGVHYFLENSKTNSQDFISEGSNFLKSKEYGTDSYQEKTRVIATGKSSGGLPIIYTAISDGEENDIKEVLIDDLSADTSEKVQNIAESKLAELTNRAPQAIIESYGLESVNPGDNIWIIIPRQRIYGQYKLIQIMHRVGAKSGGWRTESMLEEEFQGIAQSIQNVNQKGDRKVDVKNSNKLNYSWNFDFSSDSGTHTNTEITEGVLKTTTGNSTGTWESELLELPSSVSGVELKIVGYSLLGVKGYLSTNGGVSYRQIYGTGAHTTVPAGRRLKLQIVLASENTQIEDLALLYS